MKPARTLNIGIRVWGVGLGLLLWAAFAYGVLIHFPWIAFRALHQLVESSLARGAVLSFATQNFSSTASEQRLFSRAAQRSSFPVVGLLDALYWFRAVEGDDSPRVAEAMAHLLSAELRPALRQWYQQWGDDMNPTALAFRDQLSELAGERFG